MSPSEVYVGSPIPEKPVTPVTAVTELLSMTLSQFAADGRAIEIRVPWLDETLWWVPGLDQVAWLVARGVSRGRIWTAGELMDLAKVEVNGEAAMKTVARIKLCFQAEVEAVDRIPSKREPPR
jgi:hypothetical protein